jgi:hypothetical protein
MRYYLLIKLTASAPVLFLISLRKSISPLCSDGIVVVGPVFGGGRLLSR